MKRNDAFICLVGAPWALTIAIAAVCGAMYGVLAAVSLGVPCAMWAVMSTELWAEHRWEDDDA